MIHCYSYSPEMAQEYVKMGYFIGVGGVVTFKNAKKLVKTVEMIPLSSIVLETDCPYMAPEPHRGTRNDSRNIPYVIAKNCGDQRRFCGGSRADHTGKCLCTVYEGATIKERYYGRV